MVAAHECNLVSGTSSPHAPQIVTFSGIDGAGKTTQITGLSAHLSRQGYRIAHVTFWDDVAFLSKLRAEVSLALLQKGSATSTNLTLRNDKNVRTWYLLVARSVFYLLDAFKLRRVVSKLRRSDHDFIIFDRYLYDQLVQIRSRNSLARAYIRLLLRLAPKPDFPFILDASPDEAFARKPEYPLEFMRGYRQSFLGLCSFVPDLAVVGPSTVKNVQRLIVQRIADGGEQRKRAMLA